MTMTISESVAVAHGAVERAGEEIRESASVASNLDGPVGLLVHAMLLDLLEPIAAAEQCLRVIHFAVGRAEAPRA